MKKSIFIALILFSTSLGIGLEQLFHFSHYIPILLIILDWVFYFILKPKEV